MQESKKVMQKIEIPLKNLLEFATEICEQFNTVSSKVPTVNVKRWFKTNF